MAKYSPFAEKAGMQKIARQQTVKSVAVVSKVLLELGFDSQLLTSERYVWAKLESLQPEQVDKLKEALIKNKNHNRFTREIAAGRHHAFGNAADYVTCVYKAGLPELGKLIKLVGVLSQTKVYLFWANPDNR
jgi:hypothetical protein